MIHGLYYQLASNRRDKLIRDVDRGAPKATSEGESQNTSQPMTDRKGRPLRSRRSNPTVAITAMTAR